MIAAILAAVLVNVRTGLAAASTGLSSFTGALASLDGLVAGAIPPTHGAIEAGLGLMGLLGGAPEAQAILDDAGLLLQQLDAGSAALTSTAAAATSILDRQWPLGRISFSVLGVGGAAWIACASAVAVVIAFSALASLGLRATKRSTRAYRWFHCTFPLVLVALCVLCGLLLAVAIVGADVCVAPSAAVLSVINATGENGLDSAGQLGPVYEAAQYYTSPCGTQPPGGAFVCLLHSQATAGTARADIAALNLALNGFVNRTLADEVAVILSSTSRCIAEAAAAINATIDETECEPVYAEFLAVREEGRGGSVYLGRRELSEGRLTQCVTCQRSCPCDCR